MQIRLNKSLANWPGQNFAETFCREVEALDRGALPLQRALERGSLVLDRAPRVILLNSRLDDNKLAVRAGVFFDSVIAGCSCADDPTPLDEIQEYCELQFEIDADTGIASVDIV